MKLTVEIIGEEVKFEYEVGTSKSNSTTKFSASWLEAFTDILRLAHRAWDHTIDERTKQAMWSVKPTEEKP